MESTHDTFVVFVAFVLVALISKQVGHLFTKIKLPLVTGFLFTGILAGPSVMGLIPENATEGLRFVDEISLAFIAFAAGSELHMKKLRDRFKSITWVIIAQVLVIFPLGSLTIFILSGFIPFMLPMSTGSRIAVSLLAGAILVARSPSSAIAVVNELRSKGPFTQTVLGVTVITDIVVIVLFGLNASIADALLLDLDFNIGFIILIAGELLASLGIGYGLGKILQYLIAKHLNRSIKTGCILFLGYLIFLFSNFVRHTSNDLLNVEILLEPLLICMIAGFFPANYSKYRHEFLTIFYKAGPPIYTAFFTLTGASLMLDHLTKTWPIALALFAVRLVAIFIGSFSGGLIAGDKMQHNKISWMSYVTQAGIGLALAREVAGAFPSWGPEFASMMISVIILNQMVGPPLFKWAIKLSGEAHPEALSPQFAGKIPPTL
ncbi:Putative transporter [hydrothermal vent metagenome]|uniref:Transporter n=1 Tax=hydrothermal vent metagenome TaxID=652676 RepID=A0A3B1CYP5_9ZZZZ